MKTLLIRTISVLLLAGSCFAVEPSHTVQGTIAKIDSGLKTIVVTTADGVAYTFRWVADTTVHGVKVGAVDTFRALKEGTEVVVHYTGEGAVKAAVEVDKLGGDGLKIIRGTVARVDHATKVLVVKSAQGTEETFVISDRAITESGKAAEKGAKVTVYYITDGGKKVVHYFE